MTQEEFATRFHIPLGTLLDWEQGASEPDQAARAYLTVIARDPNAVTKTLILLKAVPEEASWQPSVQSADLLIAEID